MKIDTDDIITGRMIADERGIPLSSIYYILNSKGAPSPLLDSSGIKFYSRKAIAKFFKTYKPKKPRKKRAKRKAT